jgi:hypothetical protein
VIPRQSIRFSAYLAVLGGAGLTDMTAAETAPTLAACSQRYGYAMVDHWLNVDLAHQAERGFFYLRRSDTANPSDELQKLQQSLAATELALTNARDLYNALFATNAAEGPTQLGRTLDQLATDETQNEQTAVALLQTLGERMSPGSFRATPVSKTDIAPAWDSRALIGTDSRPRRIIFGSTGKAGDDRTLPLRFDFGSGIFSFYVPMAASNKLVIAEALEKRTDPVYAWMKTNHSGYHYWAGVYNNQNTYLAPWFLKEHKDEDDVWMKLANGKVLKGGEWGQVNIWNPHVRRYIQDYCETQARTFRSDPFLVCYDYSGEPHPWGAQPPGQPQYTGYSESAVRAFRDYLQHQYRTIVKLNQAWQSTYAGFEAIQPPLDPYISPPTKATPLTYEFERFRCDSHARYWRLIYDAYRRGDKTKPIEANAGMFMSGWPVEALDAYQLQKAGVADWVDMHMNNFPPNLPEQVYLYSLCRLTGKVPVQFEYVWSFPRTGPLEDSSESDFRATCQASVWRNLAWGKKVLVFFDFYYDWPAYHNAFLDQALGYSILRPSACVVPVTKRSALRFNDILMETEVATPPIIILEPTASVLNSPPLHPNQSFSYHIGVAGKELHPLLFPGNYPFLYVPEQAVLEGYLLRQHKVVILPQAPYLPRLMTERLLTWVKQGGTLICLGVPGIWDPWGRDDLRLVKQVFGPSEVTDAQAGKWQWAWRIAHPSQNLLWQTTDPSGKLTAALASFGKGRVLVSTGPFSTPDLKSRFYEAVDLTIGSKPAWCERDSFELVLREDRRGHRFLFALNPDTREVREDRVRVAGSFAHCVDLGVGSGVPVPVSVGAVETQFPLRLHPGEGTVISLAR